MSKHKLYISVFVSGAVVMTLELTGARILAPFVGTSMIVWTSLIGVILASLSIGYWYGGNRADAHASFSFYARIFAVAGIFIALIAIGKTVALNALMLAIPWITFRALIGTLILFAPPSILLGMIPTYATRLLLTNIDTSGRTVGLIYALSTIGSIVGTFAAGFVLIPLMGVTKILFFLAALLLFTALLVLPTSWPWTKGMLGLLCVVAIGMHVVIVEARTKQGFIERDTLYNNIRIFPTVIPSISAAPIRVLSTGFGEFQSGMFLDSDELVFDITKFFHLIQHFRPDFSTTLMIGGGAYSFPKDYLRTYPEATIDVVEIDPALTTLAKKYFRLRDDPRLQIFHEDARLFVQRHMKQYDTIIVDAFRSSYAIPAHLTTQEFVRHLALSLSKDGVVLVNVPGAIEQDAGKFLRAEYATYQTVFPYVYLFPVQDATNGKRVQNILLVASMSSTSPSLTNADTKLNEYLKHQWTRSISHDAPILTDDFSPVDWYALKLL